jgi:transposase-like protein
VWNVAWPSTTLARRRRTHVVRIFPNEASCLRLTRALAIETHEDWLEATRYLNMEHLKEHKRGGSAPGAPPHHLSQDHFAELDAPN